MFQKSEITQMHSFNHSTSVGLRAYANKSGKNYEKLPE